MKVSIKGMTSGSLDNMRSFNGFINILFKVWS